MAELTQNQILVIDENDLIYGELRSHIGASAKDKTGELCNLKLAVASKGSEGLALARQMRGEGHPFPLAVISQKVRSGSSGWELAGQLWREDSEIHLIVCSPLQQKIDEEEFGRTFADSDRVVLLPGGSGVALRQLIIALWSKERLERQVKTASGGSGIGGESDIERLAIAKAGFGEELDYERSLMNTFMANVPDAVFFKDKESRYVRCSQAQVERLGFEDPAEVVGKSDFDFFEEEHALATFADDQEVIRTGAPILAKSEKEPMVDGQVFWVLTSRIPWRNPEGRIIGTFGVSKDITALKQVEEEMAQQGDLLQAMLDNMPDRIYFKNTQSRFVKVSQTMVKRLAVETPEQVIGKTDFDFHPPEQARQFMLDEELIMASGEPLINKVEKQTNAQGDTIWASVTKVPVYDRLGEATGIIGISRDITALKEAEEKLERTNEELIDASRLAGMAEVATGVLRNVGNVLNSVNVSSNLVSDMVRRSKVSNLKRICEMLRKNAANLGRFLTEDEKGKQIPSFMEKLADHFTEEQSALQKELKNMRTNVDHIRDIIATQQGYAKVGGTVEPVEPGEMVENAIRMEGSSLARHDVETCREIAETPKVFVEKHKLLQVIVNMIRNAKQAMLKVEKKKMTIKVEEGADDLVFISVTDNGVGIAPENLTKIFSHGFTTKKDGHGFGLHSSALAMKEMGGSISVHSDGLGKGTSFVLTVPTKLLEKKL